MSDRTPLTYPDQNALIELGRKVRQTEVRKKVDAALQSGSLQVVVSSWHLIETARAKKIESAIELAEFIDSLNPQWLLERRNIQRLEVEEDFYRFVKIDHEASPRVTSRSNMWATLNSQKDAPKFDIPSRNFVEQWMNNPEQLEPLEKPYRDNADALTGLRKAVQEGKLTDEMRKRFDEERVKLSLPKFTPAGLEIGRELKADYVKQANIQSIPTFAVESAISQREWGLKDGSGVDRNTLIDKFHLVSALPYVDEIVSSDGFFHTIYPFAQNSGHVRATLIRNEEFLKRFE